MKNGFKLLGLRILKDCHQKFRKNLQIGKVIQFYSNYAYIYTKEFDGEISKIEEKSPILDIYSIQKEYSRKLSVNISAVVGKNGCGKSTLMELLLMSINQITRHHFENQKIDEVLHSQTQKFAVELYVQDDCFYKIKIINSNVEIFYFDDEKSKFELDTSQGLLQPSKAVLFYTLVLDYSLYGLNDKDDPWKWVKKLYHKNDSYFAPIVLTPLRTEGNININRENYLAKSRLLANLFNKNGNFQLLTEKEDKATSLQLALNEDKLNFIDTEEESPLPAYNIINDYLDVFLDAYNFKPNANFPQHLEEIIRKYLYKKLSRICLNYSIPYWVYFDHDSGVLNKETITDFVRLLSEDRSHRTIKFRQALNFYTSTFEFYTLSTHPIDWLTKEINRIYEKAKLEDQHVELIEFIPPSFLDPDIVLAKKDDPKTTFMFNTLSSGEKQRIYSISSIIYHIYNIDSVHKAPNTNSICYSNVNIIYDEVELYFHPEMQARYISSLLKYLSAITLNYIEAINMMFITHSPFILSDIIDDNVMYLEDGIQKEKNLKTFGANIHELLADAFFMTDGTIGKFASERINETLNWLKKNGNIKLGEDYFQIVENNSVDRDVVYHKQVIDLIGEPVVRYKLLEMFNEFVNEITDNSKINRQNKNE